MLEGREHRDFHMIVRQPPVGDARPQYRVHLRHVRAPEHEGVGGFEIIVAAHRLVHAERPHETRDRRGHAVARIGVDMVRAEPRLHQLVRGIAFPDRPLARPRHADPGATLRLQHALELRGHDIERLVPAHGLEIAVLGELPILFAQQRRRQPVVAVHDLGEEIALHTVEPAIDLGIGIAMRRHDAIVLHRDLHPATGAAETARRLRPFDAGRRGGRRRFGKAGGNRDASGRCRGPHRAGPDEITARRHKRLPCSALGCTMSPSALRGSA